MDRIIKLSSKQGSFNTTDKNLCDFTIPAGSVYNLKDSYINVNMTLKGVDTNTTASAGNIPNSGGVSNYMVDLSLTDNDLGGAGGTDFYNYPNACLVKNCFMSCSNKGKIDEVRRVDALKNILYMFEKDLNEEEDRSYYSLAGTLGVAEQRSSPFLDAVKEGSLKSSNKSHNVRIKLNELFDIANEEQYDAGLYGDTDIHLEMNFDKLKALQTLGASDGVWARSPADQGAGEQQGDFEDVPYVAPAGGGVMAVNTLTTKCVYSTYDFKRRSPYFVNQKLSLNTTNPVLPARRERVITSISHDETTGKITITLDAELVGIGAGSVQGITAIGVDIASSSLEINKMDLVLKVVVNPQNVPNQLNYYSYDLEEDNHNNRVSVRKNYLIDAGSNNIYVGFGTDIFSGINGLNGALKSYRLTLNNENLSDRTITRSSPLNYDDISKTYLNNGRELKHLGQDIFDIDADNSANLQDQFCILAPVKENPNGNMNVLGLEMTTTGGGHGVNGIKIYTEKLKTI